MTEFLQDVMRQPTELKRTLRFLNGRGKAALEESTTLLRRSAQLYLTGIGSSWHAALNAAAHFYAGGVPVCLIEAAELLHFGQIPARSAVIVISRSGRSIEIVKLLEKAQANGARVIGLTNSADGVLAQEADLSIAVEVKPDHAISVNTYSTLELTASFLASSLCNRINEGLTSELSTALDETEQRISHWIADIESSPWLSPANPYYFLARAPSLGTIHETRLLWEEGAKMPATAMGIGGFRHGPQEMVCKGRRFGIWIDGQKMREEDLQVTRDLMHLGAEVMVVGQLLPALAGALCFQLPHIPAEWQSLIDIVPGQLLADRLAKLCEVDCDTFRYCSYVVEREGGLMLGGERAITC